MNYNRLFNPRKFALASLLNANETGAEEYPMTETEQIEIPLPSKSSLLICSPYLALAGESSIWKAAARAGVNSVELLINQDLECPDLEAYQNKPQGAATAAEARRLKRVAGESGIDISVFVAPLPLGSGLTEPPRWSEKLLETAHFAGARQVSFPLVTSNFMVPEISDQDYIDSALNVLSGLVETSQKTGVKVLFENLSVYLNRPEVLGRILEEFSREELGFCLDPVNLCWYGHPREKVYEISESLAERATGLHIKNIRYPGNSFREQRSPGWRYDELVVPAEKGDLDFRRIISHFRKSGFAGYFGIEDDSLNLVPEPERMEILQSTVRFVKGVLKENPLAEGTRI